MHRTKLQKGFSLVEMIVYISILILIVGVLLSSLQAIVTTYRHIKVVRTIESSALTTLERITREIKNGTSVTGTFGNSSSSMTITGKDTLGNDKTTYIYKQNNIIYLTENSVSKGQLTSSSTQVTNFTLRLIDQTYSDAVKIELTVQAGSGDYQREETFYSTAILRGSYQ
jgi:type II secretory pathway pseudopilin PulG